MVEGIVAKGAQPVSKAKGLHTFSTLHLNVYMSCLTKNVSNLTEIQAIQKGSHHFSCNCMYVGLTQRNSTTIFACQCAMKKVNHKMILTCNRSGYRSFILKNNHLLLGADIMLSYSALLYPAGSCSGVQGEWLERERERGRGWVNTNLTILSY